MARLGIIDRYELRIYTEQQCVPSFHLFGEDLDIEVAIKDLKIIEIKGKSNERFGFKNGQKLSDVLLKKIVEFMNTNLKDLKVSRKSYFIQVWNDNNPNYEIDDSYIEW